MTNAEKYKEVFGFEPPDCPTWHCPSCPVFKECSEHHFSEIAHKWWNSEYKGGADMIKKITQKGEWIKIGEYGLAHKCNRCGEVEIAPKYFCPNCGAHMQKGGAE